ncbi:MAG: sugar kinase [Sporomusaceae bacterium]|nr:sugar kinase [Sporomusaceae bacterium]
MADIVTIGETMMLLNPQQTGSLRYVTNFTKTLGGAESNLCIAASRLGHTAGWISRLGDDEFGLFIRNFLRGEGVDTEQVVFDGQAPTAVFFKERREGAESRVYYYRKLSAASRLTPADLDEDYIKAAKFLHITGITPALSDSCRETVFAAVTIAKKHGVQISFDPNIRLKLWSLEEARPVLTKLAELSDYFFPGEKELEQLYPGQKLGDVVAELLAKGVKKVILKEGETGCTIFTKEEPLKVPGCPVTLVDPIGAGDGFAAGFLAGKLRNLSDYEAGRLGNAVGAMAVTATGDIEGYPTDREVQAFLCNTTIIER